MGVPILGKKAAASKESTSKIVATFPDDHSIDGSSLEILNVTPEQIAVVQLYLSRFALVLMANREAAVVAQQQQEAAVRASLAQERN